MFYFFNFTALLVLLLSISSPSDFLCFPYDIYFSSFVRSLYFSTSFLLLRHSFFPPFILFFLPSFPLSFLHSFFPSFLPFFLPSFLSTSLHSFLPPFIPSYFPSFLSSIFRFPPFPSSPLFVYLFIFLSVFAYVETST